MKAEVGYERRTSLPTAGVIVKACLDDCSACEPELEKKIGLELQRLDLQNKLLAKQIELLEEVPGVSLLPGPASRTTTTDG